MQPMRVFDLLRMTSGLVYPDEITMSGKQAATVFDKVDKQLFTKDAMTTREIADALGKCTLAYEPGKKSDTGWHRSILPLSIKIIAAAAVTGLLWENNRKMV